jgi:hypothetical protein
MKLFLIAMAAVGSISACKFVGGQHSKPASLALGGCSSSDDPNCIADKGSSGGSMQPILPPPTDLPPGTTAPVAPPAVAPPTCTPGPEDLQVSETVASMYPSEMDLTSSNLQGNNGMPPRQVFVTTKLAATQKIYLDSVKGETFFRIYQGAAKGHHACSAQPDTQHGWYLQFKNDAGAVIVDASQTFSVNSYKAGITVPAGATSAWLGYRDVFTAYDDNEPYRKPNSGSTGGCTFVLHVNNTHVCPSSM